MKRPTSILRRRYGHGATAAGSDVAALADKYMAMLGIVGERPTLVVLSKVGAGWLGRTKYTAGPAGRFSRIELQRSILSDPRTLERVVAHEMIHHRDMAAMTDDDLAVARIIKPEGHGESFLQGAALVNSVMGEGFVTVTSDKAYVQAPHTSELFLLIAPAHSGRLGWAWAARLSPEAQAIIAEKVAEGARLVRTTDLQWTYGGSARIKKYGGLSVPKRGGEQEAALRALYEGGSSG